MRWLESYDSEPQAWQESAHFGDTLLWVTAEELRDLAREQQAVLNRYLERQTNPELRPPDARLVGYLHLAFPVEPSGTEAPDHGSRD